MLVILKTGASSKSQSPLFFLFFLGKKERRAALKTKKRGRSETLSVEA